MAKIKSETLIDNMVDYLGDFIEKLHQKDPDAISAISDNLEELQEANENLLSELQEKEDWTQEDMMELCSINLLLAASMGVPDVDEDDNDNDETSDTSETSEASSDD